MEKSDNVGCARIKTFKIILSLFRSKKWSGGILSIAFTIILIISYSLMGKQPQEKQSAYDFFRNHPSNTSNVKNTHQVIASRVEVKNATKSSKRPHFINVKGLDDLYAPANISKEESNALLVWAQMRLLLSRSDALAKTAQGLKEASIAWKELLSVIAEAKVVKSSISNKSEDKICPYSVNTIDRTTSRNGTILEVPCGLIEDSSITIVGIPNEHNGSFAIELQSSQLMGEENPPIILHYEVSLPGDNMTEEPFIIQNTWSHEHHWGKEERCPAHGSASNPTSEVDGLVLCNEQIVRSTMDGHPNGSHPGSDIQANVSQGNAHASPNFPFAEGNPFTATLWVGSEGFHMTVNGRHETSFAFREKFEPWAVSGFKINGGLNILSALARGLPVSEDHDLVVDAELLKAPVLKRKRLTMLVGIFSTGNNFERRMALRRSWMQYEAVRKGDVAVRFFIGLHKNSQVNFELWKEAQAYGDVQLMPFVDYYSLISLKTIAICIMGTKILPAKYIMKTDDDAFVRIDEVLSSLKEKSSNALLYGLIAYDSTPHRDKDSKWYVSEKEWPHSSYPPWAHGPGYVISRDIAKFIVRSHQEGNLKLFKLEDVAMGIWIEEFKKSGQEVNYMSDDRFYNAGCESNYILAHYQNPRLVLCLWEKLQSEHQAVCCE
ncbi:hydroxyproline O-galactosyltransferase GALT3 [Mercurialis annua]|uniref:hydroxyproline O-galactosyltransferase GALT3 n=1 Tax=Mercurialis annua TaxID=3986 RepID=UPI00215F0DDE|nr:hydroxyproline O-galactosyltransferase GALT3 [Mercurialis annua]XP_050219304.1 hydroxyproline O-galactosyltransferase GALT3 [Mercurialis annua]